MYANEERQGQSLDIKLTCRVLITVQASECFTDVPSQFINTAAFLVTP